MKINKSIFYEHFKSYNKVKEKYLSRNYNIVELDCKFVNTKYDIFNIFSETLNFPDYFGDNWDALEECINDLEWLKSKNMVILISNITHIKAKEFLKTFIDILVDAHNHWSQEKIDFSVVIFAKKELDNKLKKVLNEVKKR